MQLLQSTKTIWAKKNVTKDGTPQWLPLAQHLTDTMNTIWYLFNHQLSIHQQQIIYKNTISYDRDPQATEKLVKFVGFFHDLGKATPAFQNKTNPDHGELIDQPMNQKLASVGLNLNPDKLVSKGFRHERATVDLLQLFGFNSITKHQSLEAILDGHHGAPADFGNEPDLTNYIQHALHASNNLFNTDQFPDPNQPITNPWLKAQQNLIQYGIQLCELNPANKFTDVPNITEIGAVLLNGLLIYADWLASSTNYVDTKTNKSYNLFPLINLNQGFDDIDTQQRFQTAIKNWKNNPNWQPTLVTNATKQYQLWWGFTPNQLQAKLAHVINRTDRPGIIVIEAGMGTGKTEAALTTANQVAHQFNLNGIFWGLPTQATANAMFSRIKTWLLQQPTSDLTNTPLQHHVTLSLMHSKAQFNPETKFIDTHDINNSQSTIVTNSWFNGKKNILNDFVVGTVDNVLALAQKKKHLMLRHLGLTKKVIVLDEVHAYDTYMDSYLKDALHWLGAYNIPVILLSATLPSKTRQELIYAYRNLKVPNKNQRPAWTTNHNYPLVTYTNHQRKIHQFSIKTQHTKTVKLYQSQTHSVMQEAQTILHQAHFKGVIGIIVNTVKHAQQLYQLISPYVDTKLLHSRFLTPDREAKAKQLLKLVGKHGQRPRHLVIIGTQVLEQSLDIDFDVLYTEIAPVDLLLQRIGRLHRHNIKRPPHFQTPRCYILNTSSIYDNNSNNCHIYPQYLLQKTNYYLKSKITLPTDIPTLIQKVYDPANDKKLNIYGLKEMHQKLQRFQKRETRRSQQFQLETPKLEEHSFKNQANYQPKTLYNWLNAPKYDPDSQQKLYNGVRDIADTLEITLLKTNTHGKVQVMNSNQTQNHHNITYNKNNPYCYKLVAQQTLNLPQGLTLNQFDNIKNQLENYKNGRFPEWNNSYWLKYNLPIVLNSHSDGIIKTNKYNINLHYDHQLGLSYCTTKNK